MNENLDKKVISNAISAYLMVFVSALFLLNKDNKYINNDFVKSHTKSALLIHLGFLITYIIFIWNWVFWSFEILWFSLSYIIWNTFFIILLILLIIWIYKAQKSETFNIWNNISISKRKILDITWNWKVDEKDKLTILLSFIPFIWFLNFAKYKEIEIIRYSTRFNTLISLIIVLLYISWHNNLANLLSLIYIIFISFIWINLFWREELIQIKITNYLSFEKFYTTIKSLIKYLFLYFKEDNRFKNFKDLEESISEKDNKKEKEILKELTEKREINKIKYLIYIPIINFIFLFKKQTKYSYHIINWIIISVLTILIIVLSYFWYININTILILVFPILFWTWYIKYRLFYKMPLIYDLYIIITKIFFFINFWTKKINEKRKEEHEIKLKPKK